MGRALKYEEGIKYEVHGGQLVAMASGTENHASVKGNIYNIFKNYLKGKFCRVYSELDVYLSEEDTFIPDVMVVCKPDIIKKDGIHGAPDLVVEVLSPSTTKRDRGYKMQTYAKCGVKELWLVDSKSRTIEVYLLDLDRYVFDNAYVIYPDYVLAKMSDEEKAELVHEFSPSIFDDLIISVEDVFDDLLGDF